MYAGGGSLDGTVNAFMPGRSGRLVAAEGLVRGFEFLLADDWPIERGKGRKSTGPLKVGDAGIGEVGVWSFEGVTELLEFCDELLFLRPILRKEPRRDRLW